MTSKKPADSRKRPTVQLPQLLYDRVKSHCEAKGIKPIEFIIEAISEKLASIHKEKRKKQRL